jgi:cytochrome P450
MARPRTSMKINFQPYSADFAADPYPVYAAMREHSPIFYSEEWRVSFATRHEDICKLLGHASLGRTMDHVLKEDELAERRAAQPWSQLANYRRYIALNLLETEGADHARLRRLLVKGFTSSQISRQREGIQALADEALARLHPRGRMEFMSEFVAPLTVYVIASLLGLPEQDHHLLAPWSAAIIRLYEKDFGEQDLVSAERATTEFVDYLSGLIEARRVNPGSDLISVLVQVEDEGLMLKNDELVSTCILLLNAGHESTINAAGNGLLALLQHPQQCEMLRADPGLAASAVEEMLRYDAPLQYFHRFVLEDMVYSGVSFRKGETLGLLYGAANRDPAAFDKPDVFDICRAPNKHLAFGRGRHFCLGAPLARLELEIIFASLLRVIPDVRLAPGAHEYHPGLVFRGLKSLELQW